MVFVAHYHCSRTVHARAHAPTKFQNVQLFKYIYKIYVFGEKRIIIIITTNLRRRATDVDGRAQISFRARALEVPPGTPVTVTRDDTTDGGVRRKSRARQHDRTSDADGLRRCTVVGGPCDCVCAHARGNGHNAVRPPRQPATTSAPPRSTARPLAGRWLHLTRYSVGGRRARVSPFKKQTRGGNYFFLSLTERLNE